MRIQIPINPDFWNGQAQACGANEPQTSEDLDYLSESLECAITAEFGNDHDLEFVYTSTPDDCLVWECRDDLLAVVVEDFIVRKSREILKINS